MNIRNLWNNYKLVQFDDGRYGIRRGWMFYTYLDLVNVVCWWSNTSNWYYTDCRHTNIEHVLRCLDSLRGGSSGRDYNIIDNKE